MNIFRQRFSFSLTPAKILCTIKNECKEKNDEKKVGLITFAYFDFLLSSFFVEQVDGEQLQFTRTKNTTTENGIAPCINGIWEDSKTTRGGFRSVICLLLPATCLSINVFQMLGCKDRSCRAYLGRMTVFKFTQVPLTLIKIKSSYRAFFLFHFHCSRFSIESFAHSLVNNSKASERWTFSSWCLTQNKILESLTHTFIQVVKPDGPEKKSDLEIELNWIKWLSSPYLPSLLTKFVHFFETQKCEDLKVYAASLGNFN